jgi:L-ascorbate metabolism protein UlaG (beta-lactamase superfamily)
VKLTTQAGNARTLLQAGTAGDAVALAWLGQAGFALAHTGRRLLIDPYLSDRLAEKYRGTRFPHVRMMPPPIEPEELHDVDLVLCTHRHGDHADPGTFPAIVRHCPQCRFVLPAAERQSAADLGLPGERVLGINAGEVISPLTGIKIAAIPSAHEVLTTNTNGEHRFLGYVIRMGGVCIYHSGDCAPYIGQVAWLRPERVDVALLPVNGRDVYRLSHGILGNMTFDEAAALCREAGIGVFIPHHFGMFDFNTVDPDELRAKAERLGDGLRCVLPSVDSCFMLIDEDRHAARKS